jgi:hypothetical protein
MFSLSNIKNSSDDTDLGLKYSPYDYYTRFWKQVPDNTTPNEHVKGILTYYTVHTEFFFYGILFNSGDVFSVCGNKCIINVRDITILIYPPEPGAHFYRKPRVGRVTHSYMPMSEISEHSDGCLQNDDTFSVPINNYAVFPKMKLIINVQIYEPKL